MELICMVCKGRCTFSFSFRGENVFRCGNCGLEFLNPQPSDQTLADLYTHNYFLGEGDGISSADVKQLKSATASFYLDQIASLRPNGRGRLLEIGCGSGDFLLEASKRGFEVSGTDYSDAAVATANGRLGDSVVMQGEVETLPLPQNHFDVVVFADVIEHVRNPISFIQAVHSYLASGGMVFIVTPSTDTWSKKLTGERWMEYKTEHLYYFNRKSLKLLLEQHGFSNLRFLPNYKILSLRYIDAHFKRFPVPVWSNMSAALTKILPGTAVDRQLRIRSSGIVATSLKQ